MNGRITKLWFDVEKKNDTTEGSNISIPSELWFDVEKKNDTTLAGYISNA